MLSGIVKLIRLFVVGISIPPLYQSITRCNTRCQYVLVNFPLTFNYSVMSYFPSIDSLRLGGAWWTRCERKSLLVVTWLARIDALVLVADCKGAQHLRQTERPRMGASCVSCGAFHALPASLLSSTARCNHRCAGGHR